MPGRHSRCSICRVTPTISLTSTVCSPRGRISSASRLLRQLWHARSGKCWTSHEEFSEGTTMSQDNPPDPKLKITVPPSDGEHQYNSEYSPASVLVVDDDEQLREGYRRLLTKAGIGTV